MYPPNAWPKEHAIERQAKLVRCARGRDVRKEGFLPGRAGRAVRVGGRAVGRVWVVAFFPGSCAGVF